MAMLHRKSLSFLLPTLVVSMWIGIMGGCKGGSAPSSPAPTQAPSDGKQAEPTLGKLDEKNFSLEMKSTGLYKVGQQSSVEVVLEPKGEFHCNQEYPYKIKLGAAPAGITYPQPIVKADAITVEPAKAIIKVPFMPDKPGEAKVSGNFYFSVCTSQQCVIDNRELAVMIKVE